MISCSPRRLAVYGLLVCCMVVPVRALGQENWIPPNAQKLEKDGTVAGVAPGAIQMLTDRQVPWIIQITRESEVRITGTAEPDYLRPGIPVKLTAEIDGKGALQSEIAELEIFTPTGKGSVGVFPVGGDASARPITKLEPGTYEIRGKVVKINDGEISISAGKKITGTLAGDVKIAVNVSDISFAQPEDPIKVQGYYFNRFNAGQGRPGQAVGKEVEITLSKPLAGAARKAPARSSRPGKNKPAEEPAIDTEDPFGLEKAGDK